MDRQTDRVCDTLISRFLSDTSGANAVEYGFIAALIALVIVAAIFAVGDTLLPMYESFEEPLSDY